MHVHVVSLVVVLAGAGNLAIGGTGDRQDKHPKSIMWEQLLIGHLRCLISLRYYTWTLPTSFCARSCCGCADIRPRFFLPCLGMRKWTTIIFQSSWCLIICHYSCNFSSIFVIYRARCLEQVTPAYQQWWWRSSLNKSTKSRSRPIKGTSN